MQEDIFYHDHPELERPAERDPICTWGWACAQKDCPVYLLEETGRDMEAEGFIKTSGDDVTRCSLIIPKALPVLTFLAKIGLVVCMVLGLCTVFMVPLWGTVGFGCGAVAFHSAWRWLEGRKVLWRS